MGSGMCIRDRVSVAKYTKLTVIQSLFLLPWLGVNVFLRISGPTAVIYGLALWLSLPALVTGTQIVHENKVPSLKGYLRMWQHNWKKVMLAGGLALGIPGVLVLDSLIIMTNLQQLTLVLPVLYINLGFVAVAAMYFLQLRVIRGMKQGQALKLAALLSWRYLFSTGALIVVLGFWLVIGYLLPFTNVLGISLILGLIVNHFLNKHVSQTPQIMKGASHNG